MNIETLDIGTPAPKPRPVNRGVQTRENETPQSEPSNGNINGAAEVPAITTFLRNYKRFVHKLDPRKPAIDEANAGQSFDIPLFQYLSAEFQELVKSHDYMWTYLCGLRVDEIGIPEYYAALTKPLSELEYRNLIYPVGKGIFIHIYPDVSDSRDYYVPIEPYSNPALPEFMDQVDKSLINYVQDFKGSFDDQNRSEMLLQCLERICADRTGIRRRKALDVAEDDLSGLKYLMLRDKVGMGVIEPLISDPYIEDITCSGVGPLFVEHKIFGGLKASVEFQTTEELDHFVIKLSEKIGRPVTVREPIVDAVLPDGSRVNIVFGGDVSKRGSNFTIRKFSTTPMSLLDLISAGALSYEMAAYLSLMIGTGMNAFISGETASGKTTLLNAVTTLIPPNNKIVSIEDTPELQVPHLNWTREVVRGNTGAGASVTMFDLLKAAMRQRPNEIIIGEIRGEEGAIAFQAMQTGHACMATFHAASVEKLVQRLAGNPINIPKSYIDNLNLVIVMSAIRLTDGTPARRVISINEIISYDSEANSFNFVEVFRWNHATDKFEFPGHMNSPILEGVVSARRGLAPKDSRQIYDQIQDRAIIFRKLHERGITNFYELHNVLSQAYRQGLFR